MGLGVAPSSSEQSGSTMHHTRSRIHKTRKTKEVRKINFPLFVLFLSFVPFALWMKKVFALSRPPPGSPLCVENQNNWASFLSSWYKVQFPGRSTLGKNWEAFSFFGLASGCIKWCQIIIVCAYQNKFSSVHTTSRIIISTIVCRAFFGEIQNKTVCLFCMQMAGTAVGSTIFSWPNAQARLMRSWVPHYIVHEPKHHSSPTGKTHK